jgi:uncharacterized protein YeeX (DUF496 family)
MSELDIERQERNMDDYINVDLSAEHVDLIVKSVKSAIDNILTDADERAELENIVYALGEGDKL